MNFYRYSEEDIKKLDKAFVEDLYLNSLTDIKFMFLTTGIVSFLRNLLSFAEFLKNKELIPLEDRKHDFIYHFVRDRRMCLKMARSDLKDKNENNQLLDRYAAVIALYDDVMRFLEIKIIVENENEGS